MLGPLLKVQMCFAWRAARDSAPCQKWAKREGFVAFPKTMAGVGHLKSMRALISWEGLHFGASDLQFWEDDFAWHVQHFVWPGTTYLFRGRRSTLGRWSGKTQNALVRGRQLCTQLSIFEGSLAELFRFWCCQLQKLRKSRRLASFVTLSSSKAEEVSQLLLLLLLLLLLRLRLRLRLRLPWVSETSKFTNHKFYLI